MKGALLTALGAVFICLFFLFGDAAAGGDKPKEPFSADSGDLCGDAAFDFLKKIANRPVDEITYMRFGYEVTVEREWNVRMKIPATLEFRKSDRCYTARFRMGEPVGADLWGRFILLVYGRHTREYKKMMEDLESTLVERFRLINGKYRTESLVEILPERGGSGKKRGFRVDFDRRRRLVKLWQEETDSPPQAAPYNNQVGPLTAFFTYIFFKRPETGFFAINVRDRSIYSFDEEGRKCKPDPLSTPVIRTARNSTAKGDEYPFALFLGEENFFDVIHGDKVFFDLARLPKRGLKIPCAAFVEGIINKSKKREKAKRLGRLIQEKNRLDKESFEKRYKEIKATDILCAKNVRVRLSSTEVAFIGAP